MMAETERKRVTASEREAIMRINLITALALEIEEGMQNRFKMVPGMKRDLRLIGALGTKMLRNVFATVPTESLISLKHNVQMCHVQIGARRPGMVGKSNYDDYGTWISFKDLASLIAGCQDHCMMCGLDRETERKCTLKKALDNTGSDVSHDGGCGYRSVVG